MSLDSLLFALSLCHAVDNIIVFATDGMVRDSVLASLYCRVFACSLASWLAALTLLAAGELALLNLYCGTDGRTHGSICFYQHTVSLMYYRMLYFYIRPSFVRRSPFFGVGTSPQFLYSLLFGFTHCRF